MESQNAALRQAAANELEDAPHAHAPSLLPDSGSRRYLNCQEEFRQLKIDRICGYLNGPAEELGLIPELGRYLKCGSTRGSEQNRNWIDSKCGKFISNVALWLNVALFVVVAYFHEADWQVLRLNPVLQGCYCGGELLFLCFFTYELWQRHKSSDEGIDGFMKTGWNCYDAFLMVVCFFDASVLNFMPIAQVQAVHNLVLLLAPAFQILRLGRVVTELRLIILGILRAMRAVFWAMVLLTLVIYFFAVFSVHYVGEVFRDDATTGSLFGNMGDAMFTLFSFATLEDYTATVRHFMRSGLAGMVVALCIIVFIIFANLALLNLLTAIMVDAIVDILPKKRSELLMREKAILVKKLKELFHQMEHGGKRVSLNEFQKNAEKHREELSKLEIESCDLNELFKLIDFAGAGALSQEEFIDGLLRMSPAPSSKRELLEVQHDLHRMWNMLSVGQERLREQLNGFVKTLPAQMSSLTDEVREMRNAWRIEVSERDRLAQIVVQHLDANCSKVQQEAYKPDEWVHDRMKEMQQSLTELTTTRGSISEQLVHLLEEVRTQHSMLTLQTQSLSLRLDETLEAQEKPEGEMEKTETKTETKTMCQETQTCEKEASPQSTQATAQAFAPVSLPLVPSFSFPSQWPLVPYTGPGPLPMQEMQWSYPDLVGPPSVYTDAKVRVAKVLHWLQCQRWLPLPFDRLILRLEGAGIQLSEEEQDILKCWLTH